MTCRTSQDLAPRELLVVERGDGGGPHVDATAMLVQWFAQQSSVSLGRYTASIACMFLCIRPRCVLIITEEH